MFSNIMIVVFFIVLVFFIFYKRDMIKQIFPINITSPANQFQEQLEQTADIVIKRLEEQMTHLEYLLDEANKKITHLDDKIQIANQILNKENKNINECLHQEVNSDMRINKEIIANDISTMSIDHYKNMDRNDKRSSIMEMADLGYDITEIAKTTGISKGEIMLLLQLNKK